MALSNFGRDSLAQLAQRLRCPNADIMPLWHEGHDDWVCYLVPHDRDKSGVYITHDHSGLITIELNVPYDTLVAGYESYLRMQFKPVA